MLKQFLWSLPSQIKFSPWIGLCSGSRPPWVPRIIQREAKGSSEASTEGLEGIGFKNGGIGGDEKGGAGEGGAGLVDQGADDGLAALGQRAVKDGAQREREPGGAETEPDWRAPTETNEIGAGTNQRERTVKNAKYLIPRTDPNGPYGTEAVRRAWSPGLLCRTARSSPTRTTAMPGCWAHGSTTAV